MSEIKTILQVLPALKGGGVERGTIEISEAIIANGMRPIVVSSGGPMVSELDAIGAHHITFDVASKNPIKIYKNIAKLVKVIKENNVSLVHVRSRAPAWSVYFAAKKAGIPMLASFHGAYGVKPSIKKLYNQMMLKGQKVIAVSNFIKKHILENYKIDENKIVVVPRGADVNKFNIDNVSSEAVAKLRHDWQIPDNMPIVLMPTRISPKKKIDVVMEVAKDNKDLFFVVVGSDHGNEEYKQELIKKIDELGISDNFKFYPAIKNIELAYALSEVVITSFQQEAFGRTAVEAQAMGKLPIALNRGGGAEIVKDGENGYLVDGTYPSLKKAIETYLSLSDDKKSEMKANAIKSAHEKYTISKMKERTIQVYNDIL